MDRDTIQYIEGKHSSFMEMLGAFEQIIGLLDNDILIIQSESLNKEYFEKIIEKAKEFVP